MRDFYLFAGPNGSGKSTIISSYLEDEDLIYLNADYCARADPDIINMPDGLEKSIRAQKETERQLHTMISDGRSFAWETVFSHESRLEIMASAKRHGYLIHLFYITTKNPDINVARVRTRVQQGGHDVPEDKIRSRYRRSISFLPQMIVAADEVMVFDNSSDNIEPQLLFQKFIEGEEGSDPQMIAWRVEDGDITEWVITYLIRPLERLGYSVPCYY
jgi:predicted ABC-type ATPase